MKPSSCGLEKLLGDNGELALGNGAGLMSMAGWPSLRNRAAM